MLNRVWCVCERYQGYIYILNICICLYMCSCLHICVCVCVRYAACPNKHKHLPVSTQVPLPAFRCVGVNEPSAGVSTGHQTRGSAHARSLPFLKLRSARHPFYFQSTSTPWTPTPTPLSAHHSHLAHRKPHICTHCTCLGVPTPRVDSWTWLGRRECDSCGSLHRTSCRAQGGWIHPGKCVSRHVKKTNSTNG